MMVLQVRELKYAMSASGVSSSFHSIAVLMSGSGRFVVCIDCHLSLSFPAGARYDTIAKPFESHSCGVPLLSKMTPPWRAPGHGERLSADNLSFEERLCSKRFVRTTRIYAG